MKHFILGFLALTACCFASEKEISLAEAGESYFPLFGAFDHVVKINPGDEVPFTCKVEGDVLALEDFPETGKVKARMPLYMKIQPIFLFSTDKENWESFEGFFTGRVGVSLGANGEIPFSEFYAEVNKR